LAEKRRNEVTTAKALGVRDATKLVEEQKKEAKEEHEGQKLPLPEPEINTKQGGVDPQIVST